MSIADNTAVVRRFAEEILNGKRLDRAEALVAHDYVDHAAMPGQSAGLDGAKQKWGMWVTAGPDLRVTTDDIFGEGDRVAVRWTAEGVHQGTLMGIPPTGKRFRFEGISIFRIADGKIAEQWETWDKLNLLQQLGVLPTAAASAHA
jgi:steroid delta-isomerase-like uncharacterized protein